MTTRVVQCSGGRPSDEHMVQCIDHGGQLVNSTHRRRREQYSRPFSLIPCDHITHKSYSPLRDNYLYLQLYINIYMYIYIYIIYIYI